MKKNLFDQNETMKILKHQVIRPDAVKKIDDIYNAFVNTEENNNIKSALNIASNEIIMMMHNAFILGTIHPDQEEKK